VTPFFNFLIKKNIEQKMGGGGGERRKEYINI